MRRVIIRNLDNNIVIASKARFAEGYWSKLKGLLGEAIIEGGGLVLKPCRMVHSIGMKMTIDVIFVSASNRVVYIIPSLIPNRISPLVREASYVIELPEGQSLSTKIQIGHNINMEFIT